MRYILPILICVLLLITGCGSTPSIDPTQPGNKSYTMNPLGYTGGTYVDYDEQSLLQAQQNKKDIVLFFHADRCPTCNAIQSKIEEEGLPENLTILKVDYDIETELKKKYRILTQSSFAYIGNDGELIHRRIGARDVQDIVDTIQEYKTQGGSQKPEDDILTPREDLNLDSIAYLAGGCFWCIEGPLEQTNGIGDVISGYMGGSSETANYRAISTGKTKHREVVQAPYDSNIISYEEILDIYLRQIDPTDDGGQFADRGFQYTTAIFVTDVEQKKLASDILQKLEGSGEFDKDIVVSIEDAGDFYRAEEEHQDYYIKQANHYNRYKKGSGRAGYIDKTRKDISSLVDDDTQDIKTRDGKELTDLQRKVLFEGGTEPPFDNPYRDSKEAGIYVDLLDGTPLFSSTDKFASGTGRPAFSRPIGESLLDNHEDRKFGLIRTEIKSSSSDTHLGHVFNDGPAQEGGLRYCINSAALDFVPYNKLEENGYEEYMVLFE